METMAATAPTSAGSGGSGAVLGTSLSRGDPPAGGVLAATGLPVGLLTLGLVLLVGGAFLLVRRSQST